MMVITGEQTRWLRLRSQRLISEKAQLSPGAAQVVADASGVQAQEKPSALLGIRVRSSGLKPADIESALYLDHTIVHTWAMRSTLHLVSAQDLAWMLPLLGPAFIRAGRRRNLELGLDDQALQVGTQVIQAELARKGPLTRHELRPALQAKGIPTEGQATIHLIANAALEGVICVGPDRGGKPTYTLLEGWAGPMQPKERSAALADLARRYLDAFAPAGVHDFAHWSGLSMQDAGQGWHGILDEAIQVEADGKPAWMPQKHLAWLDEPAPSEPLVHLLPRLDGYLLGYASRELAVAAELEGRIHPGGGIIHAVVLVDGRAAGTWELKRQHGRLEISVDPFEKFSAAVEAGIEAEISDIRRFLE